ncbi:MAG: substrate-binding domain-containing protein [Bacteroidales bacterium]|nr:substrate-binding domain-containing protein [Bacteroidales bacterium]
MKTYQLHLFTALILVNFTFCKQKQPQESTDELKGNISISGAFALYPLTVKWAEEFENLHPGVNIDVSAGGAGKGMTDVLSDMVHLAMFSREVEPEEEAKGAWKIGVSKDAVLPTMNANNPFILQIQKRGITRDEFIEMFLSSKEPKWDTYLKIQPNKKINVYTRSDACGAAAMWAEYLGKNQEDLMGTGVFGDPGIADAVKNDIWGIGFNNVIYVYDITTRKKYENLEILPVDLNENGMIDEDEAFYNNLDEISNAIKNGIYPSPPARVLYLISHGKPTDKIASEFLKFVVGEGQKYVYEAGYVQLDSIYLANELKKLD